MIAALLGFIVCISVLVAVHEYGHFFVARRAGVKVERFSIGFGPVLFSCADRHGTEFAFSLIPLGGYVKLLGQGEPTSKILPTDTHMMFNSKSVWWRIAILLAGPAANFLLAIVLYWFIFVWGVQAVAPVLGNIPSNSIAGQAGMRAGEKIIAVDNQTTPTWQEIVVRLLEGVGSGRIAITTQELNNKTQHTYQLPLRDVRLEKDNKDLLGSLGLEPVNLLPLTVGVVQIGLPAEKAGIQVGDTIVAVNNEPVLTRQAVVKKIQGLAGQEVALAIERPIGNTVETHTIWLRPQSMKLDSGKIIGRIGIRFEKTQIPPEYIQTVRYGFFESLNKAVEKTYLYTRLTLKVIGKMITGVVSSSHLAGPISIAQIAGQSVSLGVFYFLNFMAFVSISLGVLNLLPIPLLDGGQLVFCFYEVLAKKPLAQVYQRWANQLGILMILGFMALALYNDFTRL